MSGNKTKKEQTKSLSSKNNKENYKSLSFITRITEKLSINIGTIIFGAIFVYMAFSLFMYLTAHDVDSYQVVSGPLTKNQTYTGLVIREEEIIKADTSGYVTYYARDNAKIKKNGVIYSIGTSKTNLVSIELTDSALNNLRRKISSFITNFNETDYNEIYNFKYELEGALLQSSGIAAPTNSSATTSTWGDHNVCAAPKDGLVLYTIDGYEDYKPSKLRAEDINQKSYKITNLKTDKEISAGSPVYKLITDENWSVYIPLTAKQIVQLNERTSIRVKFLKDGVSQIAKIYIHSNDDGTYWGELQFSSGMIRYANDRFLDVELVTNSQSGLKIPNSSILKNEFYVIPEEYICQGGSGTEWGFKLKLQEAASDSLPVFTVFTLYGHSNGYYYISKKDVNEGDLIVHDSGTKYTIGKTESLEGVYCINKGYAVFRRVVIVDKNDEFCIVEKGTSYGLSQFDYIVYDSSTVDEQQILY